MECGWTFLGQVDIRWLFTLQFGWCKLGVATVVMFHERSVKVTGRNWPALDHTKEPDRWSRALEPISFCLANSEDHFVRTQERQ